jgi:hypothetical protein
MPQDSGADSGADTDDTDDLVAAARRLMEDAKAEPVPERLIELARQLEAALAEKRERAVKP